MDYLDIAKERAINAIQDSKCFADCMDRDFIFEFEYPRIDEKINAIQVGLSDVRASDGIRIRYDFDRDGYVIAQPFTKDKDMGTYTKQVTHWKETAFVQSWALEHLSDDYEPDEED